MTLKADGTKTEETIVWVKCSNCGNVLSFPIDKRDKQYVEDVAEGYGWSKRNGKLLCSECK